MEKTIEGPNQRVSLIHAWFTLYVKSRYIWDFRLILLPMLLLQGSIRQNIATIISITTITNITVNGRFKSCRKKGFCLTWPSQSVYRGCWYVAELSGTPLFISGNVVCQYWWLSQGWIWVQSKVYRWLKRKTPANEYVDSWHNDLNKKKYDLISVF